MKCVPIMPIEYKGKSTKNGGFTETTPRQWTSKEIEWVNILKNQGFNCKEIAKSIGRSEVSTQIKLKRLSKREKTYNKEHIDDKYQTNIEFINHIKPKKIIDVYAGDESFYAKYDVISNDIKESAKTKFHLDALKFCCLLYCNNEKADIIDLDPFGSAFDCFDLAIKMAQKGIVITFGELGHKRWKRLDYVSRYYGIDTLENFTLDTLIKEVQAIGIRNKKQLNVFAKREWRNIGRVWFTIEPIKITEQWETSETKVDEKNHTSQLRMEF